MLAEKFPEIFTIWPENKTLNVKRLHESDIFWYKKPCYEEWL